MIEEEKEATLLLVHNERMQDKENMWYLDNGANNHTCGDKDKFMELDEVIRGNVTFADHSKVVIKEKDTILIKLKDGSHQFIGDVYYIPTMKSNILSLGQLLEKGYEIKMKDHSLTLFDTKRVEISINKRKTLKFCMAILIFERRREKNGRRLKNKRSPASSRHFDTTTCHPTRKIST
jgi:hypothetical protein